MQCCMLVSCVYPVSSILRSECSLLMLVEVARGDHMNDWKGSTRHNLQVVELSRRLQTALQIVLKPAAPINGGPIYPVLGKPAMRTHWMANAAPHNSG